MILKGIVVLLAALLFLAVYYDFRFLRIPNWIPLAIFGLYLLFLGVQHFSGLSEKPIPVLPSLGVGAGVFVVFTILFALNLIGGGDVKLISALGFWAGKDQIVEFLLITAIAGGVLALGVMFWRKYAPLAGILPGKINLSQESKEIKQGGINKKERKTTYIPYGIAISLGGLFVVNNILTILLA